MGRGEGWRGLLFLLCLSPSDPIKGPSCNMPRANFGAGPPKPSKGNRVPRQADSRKRIGGQGKWLGKKDARVGGVKKKDASSTIDFKRDVLKVLLPIAGVVTFFAALFLLLLWLVQD